MRKKKTSWQSLLNLQECDFLKWKYLFAFAKKTAENAVHLCCGSVEDEREFQNKVCRNFELF